MNILRLCSEPYQKENSKLIIETNKLHKEINKLKEDVITDSTGNKKCLYLPI